MTHLFIFTPLSGHNRVNMWLAEFLYVVSNIYSDIRHGMKKFVIN